MTIPEKDETGYNPYRKVRFEPYTDEAGVVHVRRIPGTPRTLDVCKRSVYQEMKKFS